MTNVKNYNPQNDQQIRLSGQLFFLNRLKPPGALLDQCYYVIHSSVLSFLLFLFCLLFFFKFFKIILRNMKRVIVGIKFQDRLYIDIRQQVVSYFSTRKFYSRKREHNMYFYFCNKLSYQYLNVLDLPLRYNGFQG